MQVNREQGKLIDERCPGPADPSAYKNPATGTSAFVGNSTEHQRRLSEKLGARQEKAWRSKSSFVELGGESLKQGYQHRTTEQVNPSLEILRDRVAKQGPLKDTELTRQAQKLGEAAATGDLEETERLLKFVDACTMFETLAPRGEHKTISPLYLLRTMYIQS